MEIKYPSSEEKERAIKNIMKATESPHIGTIRFLTDAYRDIGIRIILKNSYKIFILSAVLFIFLTGTTLLCIINGYNEKQFTVYSLSVFFYLSPFVLLSTDFLYRLQEHPFDVYEMQNVCKYTAHHLILLRMPLFSLCTMMIDAGAAVIWCSMTGTQYLPQIIGLIASGVMLYSLLNISMFNRFGLYGCVGCAAVWLCISAVFNAANIELQYAILTGIPAAVHIISGAMMGFVLTFLVKQSYKHLMLSCEIDVLF